MEILTIIGIFIAFLLIYKEYKSFKQLLEHRLDVQQEAVELLRDIKELIEDRK